MAIKDCTLDAKIIRAAKAGFMLNGYKKTSLNSIANETGITTGALYSRYESKDDLFCALVNDVLKKLLVQGSELRAMYNCAGKTQDVKSFLSAIRQEEAVYFSIIFMYYEESVLLFCKSEGSSIERKMNELIENKIKETEVFLKKIANKDFDYSEIEIILIQQIKLFRSILEKGYSKEKAMACMETAEDFIAAGWSSLFEKIV